MEEKPKQLFEEETQQDLVLEKKITLHICKRIIIKITQIGAIAVVILFLISKGMDYGCYSPLRLPTLIAYEEVDDSEETNKFTSSILIEKFLSLYYPQVVYFGQDNIESHGFGRYIVYGTLNTRFGKMSFPGPETLNLHISPGSTTLDSSLYLYQLSGEFYDPHYPEETTNQSNIVNPNEMLLVDATKKAEIEKLPDSSILDVSVSFVDSYTMEQTIAFINQYPDAYIFWMATNGEFNIFPRGVTISDNTYPKLTKEMQERYPNLYLNTDSLTPSILEEHYTSTLRLFIDNPDSLVRLEEAFATIPMSELNDHYQQVKEEGVKSIGVRGHFSKADVLAMIDAGYDYMHIYDVKLSHLQSNYP